MGRSGMPETEPTVLVADHCSEFPSICTAWLDCPVVAVDDVGDLLAALDDADVVLADERLVQFAGERVRSALAAECAGVVLVTLGESDDATTETWFDAILPKPVTRHRLTSVVDRLHAAARYDRHAAAYTRLAAAVGDGADESIEARLRERRTALDAVLDRLTDDWETAFEACLTGAGEGTDGPAATAFPPQARPSAGHGR